MSKTKNLTILLMVVVLAIIPFWMVQRPEVVAGEPETKMFGGADDKAKDMIGEIAPDYKPWFEPLLEPASEEIASLLFALQAALGAGFIGYFLGVGVTREKLLQRTQAQQKKGSKR